MIKDKNKSEADLKEYNDLGGVTLREMNMGLWFSEHRKAAVKAITVFLIIISALLFIYSSYGYIIYFMNGKIDNQNELQVVSPRNLVEPMIIAPVEIFPHGDKVDLAIRLKNPNDNFFAEFEYCFRQNENDIFCDKSFIFPSEDKYLTTLAVPTSNVATIPTFVVKDIFWSRINRRDIPDWPTFLAEKVNFSITDVNFLNNSKSGLSENLKLNSLEFTVTNNSPYAYYEVPFDILVYSGSSLVAVEKYLANNFMAGETRRVKLSLAGDLGNVSRIDVIPHINIKDEKVYLKYQGESN